jgi:rare lipoprotein A
MSSLKRKIIWAVFLVLLMDVVIAAWVLVYDLKTRFPNLDLSRARLGVASWYSKKDKNIKPETANGEKFDDGKMTCASWDHPFGEKLVVINALTGKWVVCRVNDRGPNKRLDRTVDMTYAAFRKIANPKRGLVYVSVIPTEKQKAR